MTKVELYIVQSIITTIASSRIDRINKTILLDGSQSKFSQ